MPRQSVFDMKVSKVYPLLVTKAEKKGRTKAEVDEIKAKLDKAKAMGAITDADYSARLAQANKKLEHFDDIRMLKKQKDLGLLTIAEFDAKVNELLK